MASAKSKQKQKQKQQQQLALRQDDGVGDENDDENEIQETKANRFKALQLITVAKDYFAERKRKAAEKKKAEEDDPFANLDVSKDWGWLEQYQEKKKRRENERMRAEAAYADLKLREGELQLMETEEKLSWDAYELPTRNRLRLIAEHESSILEERARERARRTKELNMKEEGFTSFNGFIQDFSRWRDSPALFHSHLGHKGAVLSFRLTSDFRYVISCAEDQLVKMWDMETRKCVRTFEGHGKAVRDCDVLPTFTKENPANGRIVSASADKTVRIWDAVYAECKKIIRGHTDVVYACAFTPNGERIASASADRTLRLWDTHEGHLIYIYSLHESAVISCTFSPTGRYLLSSSDYGERHIKLWYTDMPYMKEKQVVGFRLLWEVTGVIRRFTVKYDAKPGFFTDEKAAQAEMDEEDAKDEGDEDEEEEAQGDGEDEEEDESKKEAEKEKEEERLAIELPDTPESNGFSISVNSVDRFGRQSQVTSYYAGISLTVVLRGVDPFQQFFLGAYYKRAQFECFDTKSGNRVGTFSKDSEVVGTKLCCERKAMASRPAMKPTSELTFKWKAPTVPPGQGVSQTGVVVIKATVKRDPLSLGPDEEDPGLVQVSYTLKEVDPPKKGSVLSEMSQKVDKEEKTYTVDLVANHQLFIDFIRNRDKYSAGTMLSPKCHMIIDGEEITTPAKVMETLEDIMMTGSVIVKDAKLLCNGITFNSLDRDKTQVIEKKPTNEELAVIEEGEVEEHEQSRLTDTEKGLTGQPEIEGGSISAKSDCDDIVVAGSDNEGNGDAVLALPNGTDPDADGTGKEDGMTNGKEAATNAGALVVTAVSPDEEVEQIDDGTLTEEEQNLVEKPFEYEFLDSNGKLRREMRTIEKLTMNRRNIKGTKEFEYEVKWKNMTTDANDYLTASKLKKQGSEKLSRIFDKLVIKCEHELALREKRLQDFKGNKRLPFAHAPPGDGSKTKHIELKRGDLSVGLMKSGIFGKVRPRLKRAKLPVVIRAQRELNSIMALRKQKFANAEEIRMERIPGSGSHSLAVVEVRRSSCWHYNYEIHVIDELTICHPLFCFLQVDEDELVSDGKFGMGIPHYRMDLPEIYPVNAVSYNKAAADAKKAKEELALAQKEMKERNETLEQLTPEEEKEEIQKIMEAIIDDDKRMREGAKLRRNAFERLPALEGFDREFAASGQVRFQLPPCVVLIT